MHILKRKRETLATSLLLPVQLQVNNNGHISFDGPVSAYEPVPFPLNGSGFDATQLIAPYWADADTQPGGTVWYRESSSQQGTVGDQGYIPQGGQQL